MNRESESVFVAHGTAFAIFIYAAVSSLAVGVAITFRNNNTIQTLLFVVAFVVSSTLAFGRFVGSEDDSVIGPSAPENEIRPTPTTIVVMPVNSVTTLNG